VELNSIKRTILAAVGVLALSSVNAVAQEIPSEISLQGTGLFTKDADGNGIRQHATDTGGFLIGYRYNFNRWLAAEANYGYDRQFADLFRWDGNSRRVQHPSDHQRKLLLIWRGDREASCTPSGKGHGGILAVHLMKRGTDVWLNTHATFQPRLIKSGRRCRLTVAQYASSCRYLSPRD